VRDVPSLAIQPTSLAPPPTASSAAVLSAFQI